MADIGSSTMAEESAERPAPRSPQAEPASGERHRITQRRLERMGKQLLCALSLSSPILLLPLLGDDMMSMMATIVIPSICSFAFLLIIAGLMTIGGR